MRLMVIDRDRSNANLVEQRLQAFGYEIIYEPSKNQALDRFNEAPCDIVFVDPAPLATARPLIISMRRSLRKKFTYMVLMSHSATRSEAIRSGMNEAITKPMDPDFLPTIVENARRLNDLSASLADETFDYPNRSGILGKSAMNQLFLTSIDRADRHGEESFMMFISIMDYPGLLARLGENQTDEIVSRLSQYLGKVRRQSDITGRINAHEFASLILRPLRETEPQDAMARFADVLRRDQAELSVQMIAPQLELRLMHIPTGQIRARAEISLADES